MNNLLFDLGKIVLIIALYLLFYKKMDPLQMVKTGKTLFIFLVVLIGILLIFNWLTMKEHPVDNYFSFSFIDFVLILMLGNAFYAFKKNKAK